MKKVVFVHIAAFVGMLILMFALYIRVDLSHNTWKRAPIALEVILDMFGFLFLITALLLWLWAWCVLIKHWNTQTTERNLIGLAALLIGNILGAYFVLYVHNRDVLRHRVG
ncbi:MAG: hypothetical protein DMF25_09640 [Verrucomicrobia bacterium]|nr:MAG: hypothetical protein DMF25_09640 [Verrucomicrobiota bacterium]